MKKQEGVHWRLRKVNSSIGGWCVERGEWADSPKRIRDGQGPMKFLIYQQHHFHRKDLAEAEFEIRTGKIL